ncbi:MAG: hypothetical protein ACREA2_01540, partial [Blastocatellia bacterium]
AKKAKRLSVFAFFALFAFFASSLHSSEKADFVKVSGHQVDNALFIQGQGKVCLFSKNGAARVSK